MKRMALFSFCVMMICISLLIIDSKNEQQNQSIIRGIQMMKNGQYEDAVHSLEGSGADKLLIGNAYYLASENEVSDMGKKQEFLDKSIKYYEDGILETPERVKLKFNYEFVKKQSESSQQEENQEEQGEEGQQEENQEEQGEEDQQEENQEEQGEEGQQEENQEEQGEEGQQEENQQEQGEEGQQQSEEIKQEDEQVMQILELLEQQEKESLKNNQEILVEDKQQGDGYDW